MGNLGGKTGCYIAVPASFSGSLGTITMGEPRPCFRDAALLFGELRPVEKEGGRRLPIQEDIVRNRGLFFEKNLDGDQKFHSARPIT